MNDALPEPFTDPSEHELGRVGALGAVVETGRGSLPFALVHGEALVSCAAWALGEAGVFLVDLGTGWAALADAGTPFVLHDPLCPLTPPAFIDACVEHAAETGAVTVGVRPPAEGAAPGAAYAVASPVVLPAEVVAALDDGLPAPADVDFTGLVAALGARFPLEVLDAPPEARRVRDEAGLRALEAATAPERPHHDH